jgi:carbonic anhydrase
MSDLPILLIGCDEVDCWPCVLNLEHGAGLKTLRAPGAVIPPAEPESPFRWQVEHVVAEAGIKDFILCGHTDCGILKSLFLGDSRDAKGDVAQWLGEVGLTPDALKLRYPECGGQRLLDLAVQESLLAQAERLMAFPAVRDAGDVHIELWVFEAESGIVYVFDPKGGQFEPRRPRRSGCEPPASKGHSHEL